MKNLKNNKVIAGAVLAGTMIGSFGGVTALLDNANAASSSSTASQSQAPKGDSRAANLTKLAKDLGVSDSKLKTALDKIHKAHKGKTGDFKNGFKDHHGHGQMMSDLAKKLGVSESKLKTVLDANRPTTPGAKPDTAAIAKALGVSEDKVKAAFTPPTKDSSVKDKTRVDNHRDELAKDLAKELGLDSVKVSTALKNDMPINHGPRGDFRGGPRGFGQGMPSSPQESNSSN